MPVVSVVMPVYNGEKYVAEAIDSVLRQTFTDFEFIIVDDCSGDRSVEIARAFSEKDSRIRLILSERNAGAAAARNRALAAARGEYIAMMDSDDLSLPERFQQQVGALVKRPEIGVLGTGARAVNQTLAPLYDFNLPQGHALIVVNLFIGSFIINPTVMIRRELLESVGGYEPGWRVAEDTELWSRLMWRARFANLPETLLLYRRHEAQLSTARDPIMNSQSWEVRERLLQRLWGAGPARVALALRNDAAG